MIRTSIFGNTIALWGMVFLLLVSCSDDNAPDTKPEGDIENVEMPSSDASAPIISGQMVVIRGVGFNENSKIWLQGSAKTKTSGVQADIISYSDESISFIAPQMSGNCSVVLEQGGNTQELGQVYLEERDLTNLLEYIYAVSYDSEENSVPVLYLYNNQNGIFEKADKLPQGEIIKFTLPENNGNGNVYYFKKTLNTNLYGYNLGTQQENMICSNWLYKFNNASSGMAIGFIENTLCGFEASIDKGFEIVSFGEDGKTTLLKKAFPYEAINGKYVVKFYCEDDNLLFNYDPESRCVLVTGKIRFEDDGEDFDCLLSLNLRTGDVKMLRDDVADAYYYETLTTKQGVILLKTRKDESKTIIETINPETLEKVSVLDEVNQYIVFSIYNEKNNSIYWSSSNGTSEDYVLEYNLDSKQVSVSDKSLPYIETLFSIKY